MKKVFPYLVYAVAFPLLAIGGAFVFKDKFYAWVTIAAVLLACLPFFIRFEKKETETSLGPVREIAPGAPGSVQKGGGSAKKSF